jgi:predicted small lipoprotein YifL
MRYAMPFAAVALAGCAAKTPLDLIPPEDLMMIEAAERMESQSPDTLRTPQPEPDLDAEYRAALIAAGIAPQPATVSDAPAPPPARPGGDVAPTSAAPEEDQAAPSQEAPSSPAGAISVEEMLRRVREQSEADQ